MYPLHNWISPKCVGSSLRLPAETKRGMGGKSLAWLQQTSAEYRHKDGVHRVEISSQERTWSREQAWWRWTRLGGVWSFVFFWNALREDAHRELWIHWDLGIKSGVMEGIFLEICIKILVVVALGGKLPKGFLLFYYPNFRSFVFLHVGTRSCSLLQWEGKW